MDETNKDETASKVEILLPQHYLEADVRCYDADHEIVPTPARIVVRPYFYSSKESAPVLYGRVVTDDGEEKSRSILQIGGASGKLSVSDRSKRTAPHFASGKTEDEGEDG